MPTDFNRDQTLATGLEGIVGKTAFTQLSEKLTGFTPFRVLRVEEYEIRHTNTLAWLLDPDGSHGMGRAFLNRFLRQIVGEVPAMDTSFVEVHAELVLRADGVFVENDRDAGADKAGSRDRLDILIEGRSGQGDKWAVAIEAKINSHEGEEQLSRYDDALARQFPGVDIRKCYLTLDSGEPVSSPHWQQIRWGEEVGKALSEALENCAPSDRVRQFLSDYQDLIRALSGQDGAGSAQAAELANREDVAPILRALNERLRDMPAVYSWDGRWAEIYRKHKAAFDACRDAVREQGAALLWGLIDKMLAEHAGAWERISPDDGKTLSVRFVPTSWSKVTDIKSASGRWNLFYHAEFRNKQKDIEIKLYAAPPGDRAMQKALMRRIFGNDPALRPDQLLQPTLSKLKNFLSDSGKTVKLYRQFIDWKELHDGMLSVEDQFDDAKKAFENAVRLHTAALLDLA